MAAIVALDPAILDVEPGGQATIVVRVRNSGTIVDRFEATVAGPAAAWARIEPAALSLFPGQEGELRIAFAPARASMPRAGTVPFAVRVVPAADPGGASVEEGRLTVRPFVESVAEVVPQTSRGSRVGRHQVIVENRGNAPVEVLVSASDPDRLLGIEVRPDRLIVGPGERDAVGIRVRPGETFLLGSKRTIPFTVETRTGTAQPTVLRASLLQGPVLPVWLAPLGGIAALALVGLIAFQALGGAGRPGTIARTAAPPTASPAPSQAASPSPSDAPASAGVTPSPTPGPFQFSLANENPEPFNGALRLRCPADDDGCRRRAAQTVELLLHLFGADYQGYGVVDPSDPNVPNTLPVVLSRDVAFAWDASTGDASQTTVLVVDLAPLMASPSSFAYGVVDSTDGTTYRFVVPNDTAKLLFDTLYEPAPQVTLPPVDGPVLPDPSRTYIWNNADYGHLFIQLSPAP